MAFQGRILFPVQCFILSFIILGMKMDTYFSTVNVKELIHSLTMEISTNSKIKKLPVR